MIIETIFNLIKSLIELILSIFPNIPQAPTEFTDVIDYILNLIFDSAVPILSLFIHINTIKIIVPILLIIVNFEYIYKLIMWIVKKIPLSIE